MTTKGASVRVVEVSDASPASFEGLVALKDYWRGRALGAEARLLERVDEESRTRAVIERLEARIVELERERR